MSRHWEGFHSGDPNFIRRTATSRCVELVRKVSFSRELLAGHPRDAAAWLALYGYANSALPRPGNGLADLHVILAQAVMGDDAALDARARQMEELAREGRYPSGSYLPTLARGFAAFENVDFSAAIEALAPLAR